MIKNFTWHTAQKKRYLILDNSYCKICGLIKLPIDGNPNNSMGLISHPGVITGISVSSDGKYLFTSGGDDFSINMWTIDVSAINPNAYFRKIHPIFLI
jgi:WD40 repeat protein